VTAEQGGAGKVAWMAAAAAPTLAALAFSAVVSAGWAFGAHPFWAMPDITLSEAAATRDAGEVVRLIEQEHQDPNTVYRIRDGVIGRATTITPVEAAVIVKREEMVRLLLRLGATPSPGDRHRLACAAREMGAGDVVAVLTSEAGSAQPLACAPAAATP
jgi:hypothetical protein